MNSSESEQTGIPTWLVVWCGWVAAVLFAPKWVVQRFVVQPLFGRYVARIASDPRTLEGLYAGVVWQLRAWGVVFAALYLVVRALTSRWRHDGGG